MPMLPAPIGLMRIHLPPSAMGQLTAALHSGRISPAMMKSLGFTLTG